VADQFAARTAGAAETAVQENVPMPGRLESDGPAIDGPHRMKAKVRMKLVARIVWVSPVNQSALAACRQFDTSAVFPVVCAEAENGFVTKENCFVAPVTTKHLCRKGQ
jgi:hypothetical protein